MYYAVGTININDGGNGSSLANGSGIVTAVDTSGTATTDNKTVGDRPGAGAALASGVRTGTKPFPTVSDRPGATIKKAVANVQRNISSSKSSSSIWVWVGVVVLIAAIGIGLWYYKTHKK